jgi:beta-lactam-binding protein with PASTA domain
MRRRIVVGSIGLVLLAFAILAILFDRAVPELHGLTVRQAEVKLDSADLHAKSFRPYTLDSHVCGQHPGPGNTVLRGASVTLFAHHDCH